MNGQRGRRINIWLITALFLLACVTPSLASETSNTPAPGMLNTLVAETVAAAQTLTVTFMPSSTKTSLPTDTPAPTRTPQTPTFTATYVYAFPTYTRVTQTQVIPTSTLQVGAGSSQGNTTNTVNNRDATSTRFPKEPRAWDCVLTSKSPRGGFTIAPRKSFYASWTVRNSGTMNWTSNTIDFQYRGGYRNVEKPLQDLSQTVGPGGSVTLQVFITAPKKVGSYNVFWSLKVGNHFFCPLKISFEVVGK